MEDDPAGQRGRRAVESVAARSWGPPLQPGPVVTCNFHPDRWSAGRLLLDQLASRRRYLSQFVTGTSNGGLTAHPGGDRWRWEQRMFGGVYDDAAPEERPVYGALDRHNRSVGAAPRFGSAHLRLRPEVLDRTTFCFPDSVFEPTAYGVVDRMGLLELADSADHDLLDDYVEAQVHGGVLLERDVEAVILDPCFRGTAVEEAADRLPCAVGWHPGFRLRTGVLRRHPDYRGGEIVELGCRIAADGLLTPDLIGQAVRSGRYDQQALKKVWHCLARFGMPAGGRG